MVETGGRPSRKRVFVLFGKKGSGKSTMARALTKYLLDCKHTSFVGRMKDGLATMLDIPRKYFDDPEKKESEVFMGKTLRQLMQSLGTEWGRELVHPEIWVYLAAREAILARQENVVFDDGRLPEIEWFVMQAMLDVFNNERSAPYETIEFYPILVNRPGHEVTDEHITEKAVDNFQFAYRWNNRGLTTATVRKSVETFMRFKVLNALS